MNIPKFLIGDHADFNNEIFVIHTEFPRFIINLVSDEVLFLEDIADEDEAALTEEMGRLIEQAGLFYDEQIERFEKS